MNLESILVPEKTKVKVVVSTPLADLSIQDLIAAATTCKDGITLTRPPEDRSLEEEDEYF